MQSKMSHLGLWYERLNKLDLHFDKQLSHSPKSPLVAVKAFAAAL